MDSLWDSPEVVGVFSRPWEAEIARSYLNDAGIPAWVEGSTFDDPCRVFASIGGVRLYASQAMAEDARELLEDVSAGSAPSSDGDTAEVDSRASAAHTGARPAWVVIAAALAVVPFIASAVPANLRVPAMILGPVAYLLWRGLRRGAPSLPD